MARGIRSVREKMIYDLLLKDISETKTPYSSLSNSQMSKVLDVPLLTVRDKVLNMVKRGVLRSNINVWVGDKFHQRILFIAGNLD